MATNPVEVILSATGQRRMRPLDWTEVANAITAVAQSKERVAGAEDALVALIDPKHTINVAAAELPHVQSPQDMLRASAIETLWQLTGEKHAALCVQVAAGPVSPIVKSIVALRFPEASAAAGTVPDLRR